LVSILCPQKKPEKKSREIPIPRYFPWISPIFSHGFCPLKQPMGKIMDFPGPTSQVNGDLAPGEPDFTEAELDAGLAKWGFSAWNFSTLKVGITL